jgi:hypothetical protein
MLARETRVKGQSLVDDAMEKPAGIHRKTGLALHMVWK